MNWEETIQYIRTQPQYNELVRTAYFEEELELNVERFKNSEEYQETVTLIKQYAPQATQILDIGSGNGISAIAFALDGYRVVALEPDPSNTIGAGAINRLIKFYSLTNITVYEQFAETIDFKEQKFDVVYVRQAMHHAYDLNLFIFNIARLLKKGGILFTVRDHVVYNDNDKAWFLEAHPLHKFYGGENAFTKEEYQTAFIRAGLSIELCLSYYDSVINYFPLTKKELLLEFNRQEQMYKNQLKKKLGSIGAIPLVFDLYKKIKLKGKILNEAAIPGRLYSFIARN